MSVHSMFSRRFWLAALERSIRSFAASLASLLTASGAGILTTDWGEKFSVAGMAALVSLLLAIGGGTFGKGEGPSFAGEERLSTGTQGAQPAAAVAAPAAAPAAVPQQPAAPAAERAQERAVV